VYFLSVNTVTFEDLKCFARGLFTFTPRNDHYLNGSLPLDLFIGSLQLPLLMFSATAMSCSPGAPSYVQLSIN